MNKADAGKLIKEAFEKGTLNAMKLGVDKHKPGYALVIPFGKVKAVEGNTQLLEAVEVVFGKFEPEFKLPGLAHANHKCFEFEPGNKKAKIELQKIWEASSSKGH